jgi:hypothetical protein
MFSVHRAFVITWVLDMALIPFLALLELGFSIDIKSNFFARFTSVAAFLVAFIYLFFAKRKIIVTPITLVFIFTLFMGSLTGLWRGGLFNVSPTGSYVFGSHVYYVIMPIIMISYGWYFLSDFCSSPSLRAFFRRSMVCVFAVGIICTALFHAATALGVASYDAIGMWNFLISGPYLTILSGGSGYFFFAAFASVIAGKRGIIVALAAMTLVHLYLGIDGVKKGRKILLLLFCIVVAGIAVAGIAGGSVGTQRLANTILLIEEGNLNEASAGRWLEALSAIEYLTSSLQLFLFGAGFGAQFLPWPDLLGYEDYLSHYTHFSAVSYIWVGGVFLAVSVYAVLVYTAVVLLRQFKHGILRSDLKFLVYWIWGIIVVSLFGAVLMNNSFLWFVVGCCLGSRKYGRVAN